MTSSSLPKRMSVTDIICSLEILFLPQAFNFTSSNNNNNTRPPRSTYFSLFDLKWISIFNMKMESIDIVFTQRAFFLIKNFNENTQKNREKKQKKRERDSEKKFQ